MLLELVVPTVLCMYPVHIGTVDVSVHTTSILATVSCMGLSVHTSLPA